MAACCTAETFLICTEIIYSKTEFSICSISSVCICWDCPGSTGSEIVSSHCFFVCSEPRVFVFHLQTEGSKLQRDLRAYLEAVKGDTPVQACIIFTLACIKLCMQRHTVLDVQIHTLSIDVALNLESVCSQPCTSPPRMCRRVWPTCTSPSGTARTKWIPSWRSETLFTIKIQSVCESVWTGWCP